MKKPSMKFSIGNVISPILLQQHTYRHHTQKIKSIELIPWLIRSYYIIVLLFYHWKKPLQIHQVLAPVILHIIQTTTSKFDFFSGTHFHICSPVKNILTAKCPLIKPLHNSKKTKNNLSWLPWGRQKRNALVLLKIWKLLLTEKIHIAILTLSVT